jgi:hypothetical protein
MPILTKHRGGTCVCVWALTQVEPVSKTHCACCRPWVSSDLSNKCHLCGTVLRQYVTTANTPASLTANMRQQCHESWHSD